LPDKPALIAVSNTNALRIAQVPVNGNGFIVITPTLYHNLFVIVNDTQVLHQACNIGIIFQAGMIVSAFV
jgi:hypothetical protein